MLTRRSLIKNTALLGASTLFPNLGYAAAGAASAGFFYPDEGLPHERTFMQWPVNPAVHDDPEFLKILQQTVADVANKISEFEPVVMMMAKDYEAEARKMIGAKVEVWDIATDDLWCRDSGPSFVIDGKGGLAMTQFNFNGWGNKQVHDNDGKIAAKVAERLGLKLFDAGLVGEAGGVESDGKGMLVAHESSWINPNRNKGDKEEVTKLLLETMGAKKIIFAPGVKGADITDYHIDALARFGREGIFIIQMPDELDPEDPWSRSAFETYDILINAKNLQNEGFQVLIVPEPTNPRIKSKDFVSSYVNYYVCNGAVISAEFGDEAADKETLDMLKIVYPDREIIQMNIDAIGEVGGGIHCATHEQPKV